MSEASSSVSRLQDAQGYLDRVLRELRVLNSPQKDMLVAVLQYLSDHISATRREIGAMRPSASGQFLSGTTDELEEILTETAKAANRIMDAAETIENVAGTVGGDAAQTLMAAATSIYEASAFQDITGQRITKAVRALQSLEAKLVSLSGAFDSFEEGLEAPGGDQALLNGPQVAASAASQSDIDALFESLGAP